jgi:hypothetical protein
MAIEEKTVAPNIEIVWNPTDNSGLVRFIAQTYTLVDGEYVGAPIPAGMEERTLAYLAGLGFDVPTVMQEFKDAFDAVWAERLNPPTLPGPEPEPPYTGEPNTEG